MERSRAPELPDKDTPPDSTTDQIRRLKFLSAAGWLKNAADAIKTSAGADQDNAQGAAGQGAATPAPEPGSPFDNHPGGNDAASQ